MQNSEKTDFKPSSDDAGDDVLIIDPDVEPGVAVEDASRGCENMTIADFQLSILSISSSLQITDEDLTISLGKPSLKVKALRDGSIKQASLVLNAEGNKVLSDDEKELNLKTPSGQTSGLKLQLGKSVNLMKNKNYILKLTIDPEEQIVTNPSKCLFKPVIKNVELVEVL